MAFNDNSIPNPLTSERRKAPLNPIASGYSMASKLPPQATELEQAVLGALMLEKDALSKVIDTLRPEVFYKTAHRHIFEAIVSLFQASEPVDLLTVTHQLRKQGLLDISGGPHYVSELTTHVASAANIEFHSHVLLQKFISRELIKTCDDSVKQAYEDTADVFDLLDGLEQKLYQLSSDNLRRETQSMESLTLQTIRKLEEMRTKADGVTGITTGFKRLDELTAGWHKTDLVIIAARPAMGKTAFVLSIARNAAIMAKKPVAIFSLEMAATQLVQRLLVSEAELDAQNVRTGRLAEHEWHQLNTRLGAISKAPIYIDDTPGLSVYDLRAKCRRLKAEKGIELIIIDYLQLMEADNRGGARGGNREQEISTISRALKKLAKELDVPVIALSQLSRAVETRGGDKRPMLSDLRESGAIEQDADMVMFLYRPEYYGLESLEDGTPSQGVCEIIIGKQRNGPTDTARLHFINRFGKFGDFGTMNHYYSGNQTFSSSINNEVSTTPVDFKANDDFDFGGFLPS